MMNLGREQDCEALTGKAQMVADSTRAGIRCKRSISLSGGEHIATVPLRVREILDEAIAQKLVSLSGIRLLSMLKRWSMENLPAFEKQFIASKDQIL